jgi:DNA-binding CsgD family transcriptional regulator
MHLNNVEPLEKPVAEYDKHSMSLLHNRVRNRALSLRWNLNGLMFVYSILIIIIILVVNNVNSLIVALIAVLGLLTIWLFSTIRLKKLEQEFYRQEIFDYGELLKKTDSKPADGNRVLNNYVDFPLTKRELEILTYIASGKKNREIADALSISEMTVKNHISHIFEKTGTADRIGVVFLALQNGWLRYDEIQKNYINADKQR